MAGSAQAAVLVEPRKFEMREYPLPAIGAEGGVLRLEAAGLCGTDYEQYAGHLAGTPWDVRPITPGHEIQGWVDTIASASAKLWRIKEGDRVVMEASIPCGKCFACQSGRPVLCLNAEGYGLRIGVDRAPHLWGGYATHLYMHPQATLHRAPDNLSRDVLSLANPLSNAVRWAYERGGIGVGKSILICGPGQRGLMAVVVARAAGASLIIVTGTARDKERLAMAERLGAHATIVVDEEDTVARVRDLTGSDGVDVVLDVSAGALQPILDGVEAVRAGGKIILAGLKDRKKLNDLVLDKLILKEIQLEGVLSSSWSSYEHSLALLQQYAGELDQVCTHSYALSDADKAVRVLGRELTDGHEAVHVHLDCTR